VRSGTRSWARSIARFSGEIGKTYEDNSFLQPDQSEAMMNNAGKELNPSNMHPKLINGKVWVPDSVFGGYRPLPENDPEYMKTLLWIDSQRFVELLDWIYNREKQVTSKQVSTSRSA
jgi:hypothetical protein